MYWSKQEQLVFSIVFLIVFVFQVSSIIILRGPRYPVEKWNIVLIPLNILIFLGMIPYAKWVWKGLTWFRAFLIVILFEAGFVILAVVSQLIRNTSS